MVVPINREFVSVREPVGVLGIWVSLCLWG